VCAHRAVPLPRNSAHGPNKRWWTHDALGAWVLCGPKAGISLAQLHEIMAALQPGLSATAAEVETPRSPSPVRREGSDTDSATDSDTDMSVPSSQMMDLARRITQDYGLQCFEGSQQVDQLLGGNGGGGGGGPEQQSTPPAPDANVALRALWHDGSLPHSASAPQIVCIPNSRTKAPSAPSPLQQPAAAARAGGARTSPERSPRQGFLHPQLTYQGVAEVQKEVPVEVHKEVPRATPVFSFI
jgi:hypothetical protein